MNKYLACFLACFLGIGHAWASNEVKHEGILNDGLIVNDVTLPLSGEATIDICCSFDMQYLLDNAYLGYQLDVQLAEGLELVEDNNGNVVCENGFTGTDHTIYCLKKENNTYRFIVVSMNGNQLPYNGSLLKMYVRVKNGVSVQGQTNAKVTGAKFTTAGLQEESFADVNFHINIVGDKESQNISLSDLPTMTYGDASYALPQTTVEGLSLTWTSSNTSVATISGNTLTIRGAGTATVTATQAGNDSYLPFSREFTLTVNKAMLTITANDCTKQQGEANPALTVSYSGFKYSDTAASLTKQPTVTTTATTNSPVGTYPITPSGAASNNYEFTYVSGTLTVTAADTPPGMTVTDISQMTNVIYIEPTEAICGTQVTLSVKMKNDAAIQTIQFDLYLPEGVTVVADEDGELITPSKERIKKYNYFESTMQANGAIRLLAQATTTNVPVGDGEICRVVVDVPEDMEEGEYPIVFKDVLMVESDNSNHSPDPNLVQCKLTVLAYTPGDANNDGGINAIDFNMIGNYILGNHSQANFSEKAADISGDGNVNAIDFNMVGNIILYGTTTPSKARSRGSMIVPQ